MKNLIALGNLVRTNHHWTRALVALNVAAAFAVAIQPNIAHWG